MKPPEIVDNHNMEHLIMGQMDKLHFLGKINEAEDNNSELAGFEINKLLNEQQKRENEYIEKINTTICGKNEMALYKNNENERTRR